MGVALRMQSCAVLLCSYLIDSMLVCVLR